MKNQRIIKRKYYAIELTLASPLCVSGGQDDNTDSDVLVNGNGEVFVPGTSLAGAMRNYLELKKKNTKRIFGYSDREEGRMSSVFVSDLYFQHSKKEEETKDGDAIISIRDGVKLKENKTVDNKFDMQIIETGAKGMLYLNYVVREGEDEDGEKKTYDYENDIRIIFQALQSGEIRIGSNKNRGFGRLQINMIYQKGFAFGDEGFSLQDWISFKKDSKNLSLYKSKQNFEEWNEEKNQKSDPQYIWIRVPLKLTGGISIRRYSTVPGEADYEQITCHDKPVIPGTSWNGAIRADINDIFKSLGMKGKCAEEISEEWFGMVKTGQDGKTQAKQSQVVVGESVISGSVSLPVTRNKINRFDASTINGALYTEKACFGGQTVLEIMVRKEGKDDDLNALLGMLNLVIKDIQEGYLAVGGLTSVGRGIFAPDEESDILKEDDCFEFGGPYVRSSENLDMDTCMSALYRHCKEKEKKCIQIS